MPAKSSSKKPSPDNSAAFKHLFSPTLVDRLGTALSAICPAFNRRRFKSSTASLTTLEMKARVHLIRDALARELPSDFQKAVAILMKATEFAHLEGFALWPITEYVQTFGLQHRTVSLHSLRLLTTRFTSEWAVRPFLNQSPASTLSFLKRCARDKNVHIRRWASEGSRPRLPWGMRLNRFIERPEMTLPILELLKYDPELYVRKSVANHLNDISRDNPEFAISVLRRWRKDAPAHEQTKIDWITRHALRTLIKSGEPAALKLLGVRPEAAINLVSFSSKDTNLTIGDRYLFEIVLRSRSPRTERVVIDYVVHYARAQGKSSAKVFKLRTFDVAAGEEITLSGSHHFREVTTRRHYPGPHRVEIQINGKIVAGQTLALSR